MSENPGWNTLGITLKQKLSHILNFIAVISNQDDPHRHKKEIQENFHCHSALWEYDLTSTD